MSKLRGATNPKTAPPSPDPYPASFRGQDTSGLRRALEGVPLGTAAGDALGLPAENLSPRRILGALCGASSGVEGIPPEWLEVVTD